MNYSFRLIILNIVTLSLLIYICYIGIKNIFRYNVLTREYKIMSNNLIEQKNMYNIINHNISLSTKPWYWHYLAKKELGYVHKYETIFHLQQ